MDSGIGPGPRGPPSTYERGAASSDMFSRREASAKPLDRSGGYNSPSGGYTSSGGSYGQSAGTYGGYGDSRGTGGSLGYDSRAPPQGGAYGDSRGPSSYPDSRGPPPLGSSGAGGGAGGIYSDSRGSATGSAGYGGSAGAGGYASSGGGAAYDSYGSSRSGAYDTAYPPLPQQRGYASGGGPAPRRDMPPGPGATLLSGTIYTCIHIYGIYIYIDDYVNIALIN
ncbi:hypothetical protein QE152_g22157 [Popillia japonica]|uniref:Uncharacterized protein n=1 Tax=Popillia japonica TaxID=7064 RepID=A0AAW1KL97_POPJA